MQFLIPQKSLLILFLGQCECYELKSNFCISEQNHNISSSFFFSLLLNTSSMLTYQLGLFWLNMINLGLGHMLYPLGQSEWSYMKTWELRVAKSRFSHNIYDGNREKGTGYIKERLQKFTVHITPWM